MYSTYAIIMFMKGYLNLALKAMCKIPSPYIIFIRESVTIRSNLVRAYKINYNACTSEYSYGNHSKINIVY